MPAPKKRRIHLTPREADVLQQLRRGLSYKAIGAELGISVSTASVHGSRALRKIGRTRLAVRLT